MNTKVEGNDIRLIITSAEIKTIVLSDNGSVHASVALKVGSKILTEVSLSDDDYRKDSPQYLDLSSHSYRIKEISAELRDIIKKSAVLSLERIQPTLTKAEDLPL